MSILTRQTVEKIKAEKIIPIASWRFWIADVAPWIGVILSALLAGTVTAFALHVVREIDWGAYRQAGQSWSTAILSSTPFLWVGFLVIFLIVAIALLRQTKHGYRYTWPWIFGIFLLTSSSVGFTMQASSYDDPVESFFLRSIPQYEAFQKEHVPSVEKQWSHPEGGLLGGHILKVSDQTLQIEDLNKKQWTINTADVAGGEDGTFQVDDQIKVIGEEETHDTFKAQEIKPWKTSSMENNRGDGSSQKTEQKQSSGESDGGKSTSSPSTEEKKREQEQEKSSSDTRKGDSGSSEKSGQTHTSTQEQGGGD